jgi:hypothetical protein
MMLSYGFLYKDKRNPNSEACLQICQKDFVQQLWDLFDSIGIVGQNPKSKQALLNLVVILELRINL